MRAQLLAIRQDRRWGAWLAVAAAVLFPTLLAAFLGMVVALGSPQLTLIAAASVGGVALLFVPSHLTVQALLVIAFLGVGTAMYYGKVTQAHWVPYALSLFLWVKLPLDALMRVPEPASVAASRPGIAPLAWLVMSIFVLTAVSILVNGTPLLETLIGLRNYLYIWSIAFVVAAGALDERQLRGTLWMLLALVALQAPFAMQQHFVAFGRTGNWDAVVGTFAGNPDGGGGGSGEMVMFLCFGLALAASLWKFGELRAWLALTVIMAATAATMLAETKAFFVFAPAALAVVMVGELRRRPGLALAMLALTAALMAATFLFYKVQYFDDSRAANRDATVGDYLDYAVSADSKTSRMINPLTGEVSRLGAPLVWFREAGVGGPHGWVIGYGPRASNVSGLTGPGEAARHFPFKLTTSSITTLLWDLGALGLLVFTGLIVLAGVSAWRLSREERIPRFHRAALEALAGGCMVWLASLPYNAGLVDGYATQSFLSFCVGYVIYWQKFAAAADAAKAAA